ncbi:MAG TPA: hypothetical protein VOB72_26610 [Candidatus Dormibacteraeota bacterium]|nr:hypothetical protein [Candidatus Dormibacteraeota bacterium]
MNALKHVLLVVTTALTVTAVAGLAVAASPASGSLRTVGAGVAHAVTALRPAAFAPADAAATTFLPPMNITVGPDVTLQDKLALTGTVTITCGPFISTSFSSASIQVSEPSGSDVAHASGSLSALLCDGAPHTFGFTATASDAPFHPSVGQVQVFANACGQTPDFSFQCESAQSASAVTIKR